MKKYAYSLNEENYFEGADTIEETLKLAVQDEKLKPGDKVFIGEQRHPIIGEYFDPDWMLDQLSENAAEEAGEFSDSWGITSASAQAKQELEDFINEWATKHNLHPSFFLIETAKEYTV